MMMVMVVKVRPKVISGNVAAALLGHGAHGLAGHGVVVRAADIHLDRSRLGAGRRTATCGFRSIERLTTEPGLKS